MNNRLLRFLSAENISQSQFADSIGVARASISHIISGRNKPGFDFLEKLAEKYPALSLEWLVTGNGKMYRTLPSDADFEVESPTAESTLPRRIEKVLVFYTDGTFKELI